MDILAARFKMILYQGKPPDVKPTPMLNLWRESLEDLSPAQMREGLKNYLNSEAGHFEPSPGDIKASAPGEAKDKPRVKAREDCPNCEGTSWRKVEGSNRVTRCDCRVLVYGEQQAQLPAGNPEQDRKLLAGIVSKAKVERRNVAVMPGKIREVNFAAPMTDEQMERQKRQMFEIEAKYKS